MPFRWNGIQGNGLTCYKDIIPTERGLSAQNSAKCNPQQTVVFVESKSPDWSCLSIKRHFNLRIYVKQNPRKLLPIHQYLTRSRQCPGGIQLQLDK